MGDPTAIGIDLWWPIVTPIEEHTHRAGGLVWGCGVTLQWASQRSGIGQIIPCASTLLYPMKYQIKFAFYSDEKRKERST